MVCAKFVIAYLGRCLRRAMPHAAWAVLLYAVCVVSSVRRAAAQCDVGLTICVCRTSTLHAPGWCILPRIRVKKTACTSFQAFPHHVLRSPPILSPVQWRAPAKGDKNTLLAAYSSDDHATRDIR